MLLVSMFYISHPDCWLTDCVSRKAKLTESYQLQKFLSEGHELVSASKRTNFELFACLLSVCLSWLVCLFCCIIDLSVWVGQVVRNWQAWSEYQSGYLSDLSEYLPASLCLCAVNGYWWCVFRSTGPMIWLVAWTRVTLPRTWRRLRTTFRCITNARWVNSCLGRNFTRKEWDCKIHHVFDANYPCFCIYFCCCCFDIPFPR